jgi:hypothetical protein
MVNIVGKSRCVFFQQVNESNRWTRVGNFPIAGKERMHVRCNLCINNVARSIKVRAKRIVIPELTRVVHVIFVKWSMNESKYVWQGLGEINDCGSITKFLDRNNTDIRVDAIGTSDGRGGRERLASRFIKRVGSIDCLVARAFDKTNSIRGSTIVWLQSTVLNSLRNRSKGDFSRASMPTKSQGRGAIVAAMVAVLRFVLFGTFWTSIVKELQFFVSLAFRLTSIVVKVEWRTRIKELALIQGRSATKKTTSCRIGEDDAMVIRRLGKTKDRALLERNS